MNEIERPRSIALNASVAAAGEAMQHGREGALPGFFGKDLRHVVVAIARMDHQRKAGFTCGGNMLTETLRLKLVRAGVVVIVQPGLADGHDLGVF